MSRKRNKKKHKGDRKVCPKCGKLKKLTKHHILPKRYFDNETDTLYICRECHNLLEELIRRMENKLKERLLKQQPQIYFKIVEEFLK